jgi:hypothetical protein
MAEIGLVLSILPLVISTAEHYHDILRPFKRYKNFAVEVKRFQEELEAERVIFETECLLLLASVTSYDVAVKMLEERAHPLWLDSDLDKKLSDWLGRSCNACKSIIAIIDDDLTKVQDESRCFGEVVMGSTPVSRLRAL